jgi:hypothetical protein
MSTAISPLIAAGSRFPVSTGQPDTDEKLSPIHLRSTGLLPMTHQEIYAYLDPAHTATTATT